MVYTSGTTGRPKGAVLRQEALVWNAATDRSVYTGTASGSEGDAIRFLASVAPGFIQAGALGCVVVLVVWAVLARSTAAVEGEE